MAALVTELLRAKKKQKKHALIIKHFILWFLFIAKFTSLLLGSEFRPWQREKKHCNRQHLFKADFKFSSIVRSLHEIMSVWPFIMHALETSVHITNGAAQSMWIIQYFIAEKWFKQ